MLKPNTTWGQMRDIHQQTLESGVENPDDWLSDPETREQSAGKRDDEYIFEISEEEAERYNKIDRGEDIPDVTHSFTVSEKGETLELIKTDADEGIIYVRTEGQWVPVNEERQNPRIYDQTLLDIRLDKTNEAIKQWDNKTGKSLVLDILPYIEERKWTY